MYKQKTINSFSGKYAFLSNFHNAPITYNGVTYLNSESAYQAQKDPRQAYAFKHLMGNEAKRKSRTLEIIDNWDEVKEYHMLEITRQKYMQNPSLSTLLIQTGNREIIEGNWWNDTFWGVCDGVGENRLGKILMQVRREIGGGSS